MNLKNFIRYRRTEREKQDFFGRKINRKTGSYLVEATLTLPVFILAVTALALLIRILSICENSSFLTAMEMREISIQAYKNTKSVSLCKQIENRVLNGCEKLTDFQVKKERYLYRDNHIYDLIEILSEARFTVENPVGIYGEIHFEERLVTRAFTGSLQDCNALDEAEFQKYGSSQTVIVYPRYGERYHSQGCRYVKASYAKEKYQLEMEKEDAIRKGFSSCMVCGGGG